MKIKLAVIAFPGNNCEIETLRAGTNAGFDTKLVRWNEGEGLDVFDAFVLPGGFSFEDRGRSGVVSSRERIFDVLREAARKGKVILGICNGAQMIVESGLIPVANDPLPFALAHNVRRDDKGKVMGEGFYNHWVHIAPERKDTAFTCLVNEQVLSVPIAHGEGRFTAVKDEAQKALENGTHVAFRYCDDHGDVSSDYPITPNGALFATAGIVNKEGTICAIMPHPERFFDVCDGSMIFKSMYSWIKDGRCPQRVIIGDLGIGEKAKKKIYPFVAGGILIEKQDIITDNEAFTISRTANNICKNTQSLKKSVLYQVVGAVTREQLLRTGLLCNPNKELLIDEAPHAVRFGVVNQEDDTASLLSAKLSTALKTDLHVHIIKAWSFEGWEQQDIEKVLDNNLLANPNSAKIFQL